MFFKGLLTRQVPTSKIIALGILFTTKLFAVAPPLTGWQKCFGGSLQDIPAVTIRLQDGNLLVLGSVDSNNGDITASLGSTDIWLTKVTTTGNILWQKSFGGTSIDVATSVSELAQGELIISGYSSSSDGIFSQNHGNFDCFLIKTDSLGSVLWTRTYGGSMVDLCYSQIVTSDGGFFLGGGSYSDNGDLTSNNGNQDFWVLKTDDSGNILWQASKGGSSNDVCYALAEDRNGGLYAGGASNSNTGSFSSNNGSYDVVVAKFSASGNFKWIKTFGGSDYETAQTILIDSRQNILVGGYSKSSNGDVHSNYGYADSWLMQIDNTGVLEWEKSFGGSGSENLYSIIETSDGGYLLTSGSTSNDHDITQQIGAEDVWLLKTDNAFHTEWSKNFGGSGNDRPVSVMQNADGGYLITSYTFSNNTDVSGLHGSADIWLLELQCRVPQAVFSTQSQSVCLGSVVVFSDSSANSSSHHWFLNNSEYPGSGSIAIPFTTTGTFEVALRTQTCYYSSEARTQISVVDCNLPSVNISADKTTLCENETVSFSSGSANATAWLWTFPGGTPSTSTLENPSVTYSTAGMYSAVVTVTNSYGSQSAMRFNYITVVPPTAKPVILVNGLDLSVISTGHIQWYLDGIAIAGANTVSFSATVSGIYTVEVQEGTLCPSLSEPVYIGISGVQEISRQENIVAFPNPTQGSSTVTFPAGNENGVLKVIDLQGKIIREFRSTHQGSVDIDIADIVAGHYELLYMTENGKLFRHAIIKY